MTWAFSVGRAWCLGELSGYCKSPYGETGLDESNGERGEDPIPVGMYEVESRGEEADIKEGERWLWMELRLPTWVTN